MFEATVEVPIQQVVDPVLEAAGVRLHVKRDDLIHPEVSGNKWRKLKYNIQAAKATGDEALLTFGGVHSNHIAATAAAGKALGLRTIGVIRGEEEVTTPTLTYALSCGMVLHRVSRAQYRQKNTIDFQEQLHTKFGRFYLVPEGGANEAGMLGCAEILDDATAAYDLICCASGTGTTLAGIASALQSHQTAWGFSALKGGAFLNDEVNALLKSREVVGRWEIQTDYHCGGYAKITPTLVAFMQRFMRMTAIPLDPIYTGKMLFGLYQLIENERLTPGANVLAIHTGGLQGVKGMEERYGITLSVRVY